MSINLICGPLGNGMTRPPAPASATAGQGIKKNRTPKLAGCISLGQQTHGGCFEFRNLDLGLASSGQVMQPRRSRALTQQQSTADGGIPSLPTRSASKQPNSNSPRKQQGN